MIASCGGAITQFQGDAMLVTFNAIKPDPEHARNTVRGPAAPTEIHTLVA